MDHDSWTVREFREEIKEEGTRVLKSERDNSLPTKKMNFNFWKEEEKQD